MASGNVVAMLQSAAPPDATAAQLTQRDGGSTPAEQNQIWAFDAAADEFVDYRAVLHGYDGGGLTVRLKWSAASATSGVTVWQVAVRRVADDAEDIDGSHTYVFNTVSATAASVSGEVAYDVVTFTDGADMDSLADGELFILRVGRDANNGSDTMTGDAELWFVSVEET